MKNARLIYNPHAGALRRRGPSLLDRAMAGLRDAGVHAEMVSTHGPGTGAEIARELAQRQSVDTIFVAGGDGTVNEVMNGLVHSDVALGVLPAGTANVLANELRIGTWTKAIAALPQLRSVRVPVGRVSFPGAEDRAGGKDLHFLTMAGAGLDARLVQAVSPELKRNLGKLAYWLAGFSLIGADLEQLIVTVDGVARQSSFCLASRVRNYGGDLAIAPSVHITDDDLEVVLFEGRLTASYVSHLFSVVSGRMRHDDRITVLRARNLHLAPAGKEPVQLQIDGEHIGVLPATVSLEPAALSLLLPMEYIEEARRLAA